MFTHAVLALPNIMPRLVGKELKRFPLNGIPAGVYGRAIYYQRRVGSIKTYH